LLSADKQLLTFLQCIIALDSAGWCFDLLQLHGIDPSSKATRGLAMIFLKGYEAFIHL
jgi:hypothetical protein